MARLTDLNGQAGKLQVEIYRAGYGGVIIPAELLSDSIEVTGDEGTISQETFAGTFTQPSGTYEEPQITWTAVLTMEMLRKLYPELSDESVDRPQIAGQTVFGGNDCTVREKAKVVIHQTCDDNSDRDWYFPEVYLSQNFSATFTPGEVATIPFTAHIQPATELNGGLVRVGTGSLNEETVFDDDTGQYIPVGSS